MSSGIHTAYCSALVGTAQESVAENENKWVPSQINDRWSALASHFPLFERVTLSDDAKAVEVKPFASGPSWRVGDSRAFAEQVRSELCRESPCYGLQLDTAVLHKDNMHIGHGPNQEVIDIAKIKDRSSTLEKFYDHAKDCIESNIFVRSYEKGRRGKPNRAHFELLTEGKEEFQCRHCRGLAFFLIVAKAVDEFSSKDAVSIFGKYLNHLLHLESRGEQTMYMKRLLDDDQEFKKFFDIAKTLANRGFGDFSTIPLPFRPYVKQ